jgi:hypothetical protein
LRAALYPAALFNDKQRMTDKCYKQHYFYESIFMFIGKFLMCKNKPRNHLDSKLHVYYNNFTDMRRPLPADGGINKTPGSRRTIIPLSTDGYAPCPAPAEAGAFQLQK